MTLLVGTYGPRSAGSLLGLFDGPAAALCDLVEVRLDYLPDADSRVAEVVKSCGRPVMATCRRVGEGGSFGGGEDARLDLLARASDAGAAWVDVEDDVPAARVAQLARRGAKIVRSLHVPALPENADDVVARLLAPPADAAKLVAMKSSAAGVVGLLDLVRRHAGRLAAHVSDSPFSRYAGAAAGSHFTYASLRPGGLISAPIPTVRKTVEQMRFERLRRGAPLFVLIGGDVEKSVSPGMLNHAFEDLGLPHVALRWSCDDPAPALDAILRLGWAGAAVTMPHKERVIPLLDRLAPTAEEVGAVNTVVRDGSELVGHNTDLPGLLDALARVVPAKRIAGRAAVVCGAGGAARAAVRAAIRLGATPVVLARRREAAERLRSLCRSSDEPAVVVVDTAEEAVRWDPALVVDATPAASTGGESLFSPDAADRLTRDAVVVDMAVTPGLDSPLIRSVIGMDVESLHGFEMLVDQAGHQVRLLTGRDPDLDAMHEVGFDLLQAARSRIVLVGLRCAGKTEVGDRLARLLAVPFVDSDRLFTLGRGLTPDEFIRAEGAKRFRKMEFGAVLEALLSRGVVSLGGGACLHARMFQVHTRRCPVVLLDAPDDVLLARWAATPRAPLTKLTPERELARQRKERMHRYRRVARLVLDTSRLSPDEAAESIADLADWGWPAPAGGAGQGA